MQTIINNLTDHRELGEAKDQTINRQADSLPTHQANLIPSPVESGSFPP